MPDSPRTLVAGVDSSTQSTKVVVCDAATGEIVRSGRAPHPDGTSVHPDRWWEAFTTATADGLLDDVAAIAVGGQQHGMCALDESGDGGARCVAVERHPLRPGGSRPDRRARWPAGVGAPHRLRAGAQLHGDQGALAGRARAGERRAGRRTWCFPTTGSPLRSSSRATVSSATRPTGATPRAPATSPASTTPTSQTSRSSRSAEPSGCPRSSAPTRSPGAPTAGMVVGPGTGDNAGAALGLGLRPGRRRGLARHEWRRLRRRRPAGGRPERPDRVVRECVRWAPAADGHAQRGAGADRRRPAARHRPGRARPARPRGRARCRRTDPAALPRRRAQPQPPRRHRHPRRAHPVQRHPREPRARGGRGHAGQPRRRASPTCDGSACRSSGSC